MRDKENLRRWRADNYAKNKERILAKNAAQYERHKETRRAQQSVYDAAHREEAKARAKEWVRKNPDKAKAAKTAWYEANKEKKRSYDAAYRAENADKRRLQTQRYYTENKEAIRAWQAQYGKEWCNANRDKVNARTAKRRSMILAAAVSLSDDEARRIKDLYRQSTLMTRMSGMEYHVDHIIPLARGGKHHPDNLQILSATENRRKGARCSATM
jgi:hypothetical protein